MINRVITIGSAVVFLFSATPHAAQIQLPRSGQTTCYSATGTVIPCANTGQAGDTQSGAAWPSPRFTNLDGSIPVSGNVVIDQLTGLMWTRNASLPGTTKYWQQAFDYVAQMNIANNGAGTFGYNDWRLPNINELLSLLDLSRSNPALPAGHPFNNVQYGAYWSSSADTYLGYIPSSSYGSGPWSAWGVSMADGASDYFNDKGYLRYVWPVRGGQ